MDSESNNGGLHDEVKTVTIRFFGSREAAEQAAANLQAHDIPCWVSADDCGGMYPSLTVAGGVRLHVRASDVEAATALLDTPVTATEMAASELAGRNEAEAGNLSSPNKVPRKLAPGQIFIGIIAGVFLSWIYHKASESGRQTYYHYANDGKADEEWIYQDGHLAEFRKDRNHDGQWDVWDHHDQQGNIIRREEDQNFDGKPDEFWSYSNNDLVSMERDTDFSGKPDEFCTYSNDIIQQVDMKPNGASYSTLREFFKNGVLTEDWRGGDRHGNFKEIVRYDPFGSPIGTNVFNLLPTAP